MFEVEWTEIDIQKGNFIYFPVPHGLNVSITFKRDRHGYYDIKACCVGNQRLQIVEDFVSQSLRGINRKPENFNSDWYKVHGVISAKHFRKKELKSIISEHLTGEDSDFHPNNVIYSRSLCDRILAALYSKNQINSLYKSLHFNPLLIEFSEKRRINSLKKHFEKLTSIGFTSPKFHYYEDENDYFNNPIGDEIGSRASDNVEYSENITIFAQVEEYSGPIESAWD